MEGSRGEGGIDSRDVRENECPLKGLINYKLIIVIQVGNY